MLIILELGTGLNKGVRGLRKDPTGLQRKSRFDTKDYGSKWQWIFQIVSVEARTQWNSNMFNIFIGRVCG